ncbi:hypothetical protein L1049_000756 [Liquidambar formosana]|uniref:Bulb-type lectin domain-containing protein n=1 Tax=Liquidambar formosana TaxID=63359 RepID=A0AAP0NCY4_LIQFO
MALPQFPLPIHFIILSVIFFTIAAQAQVPANKTFKFINQGEFGDRIIEYDASYRVIRNEVYTFYTFPFRLCFYNTTPDAHIFAIRAGIPNDESLMRWVWDANRNHPVRENATLTFGRDGNFALADVDGRVVWQTNTANKGVTGIKLLPNGNLVLHDKKGKFIWQSFDYPTDTLLVGQSVKINGRNKLIGRTSEIDGSDGAYSIVLEDKGFNMYIKNSGKNLIYGGWGGSNLGSTVTFDAVPENDNATAYELVLAINQDNAPPPGRRLLQVAACKGGAKVDYYKIVGVEHFLSPYLDGGDGPMKVGECREKCDKDCKCLGYFYKEDSSKCLLAPLLGTLIKVVNTSVGYIKYSK